LRSLNIFLIKRSNYLRDTFGFLLQISAKIIPLAATPFIPGILILDLGIAQQQQKKDSSSR
jgi:hypothetical protein